MQEILHKPIALLDTRSIYNSWHLSFYYLILGKSGKESRTYKYAPTKYYKAVENGDGDSYEGNVEALVNK